MVYPSPAQIGESDEVLTARQPFRLEAPDLARRCGPPGDSMTADGPAHRGIARQTLGVVHVLVSGKATEHRLPQ
jgi:hypothetical protein